MREFGGRRWFSRTPVEIDDERRAAEQAGREAFADAIRTGEDVQARTPAELVELGRSRLAQQAGGQARADAAEQPLTNPDDNYQVAGPAMAKRPAYPRTLDPIIEREVAKFNTMNQAEPGDDVYLDPDLVKAQIRVESGYNLKAYNSDPMQVNKDPRDWDGYKGEIGLKKGVPPGPELGIRAGLDWLDSKSYFLDAAGRPKPFLGYQAAFTRYNGSGDPHYWDKIQSAYRDIKRGGQ